MARSPTSENLRLQRARRNAELRRRDCALLKADAALRIVQRQIALCVLAYQLGRTDLPEKLHQANSTIEQARLTLQELFDEG